MGDQVQVVGQVGKTPTIRFVGRNNRFSDLVGEKLNESFVREILAALPIEDATFRTLMPVRAPGDHYVLVLDAYRGDAQVLNDALEDDCRRPIITAMHGLWSINTRTGGYFKGTRRGDECLPYLTGRCLGDMKQSYLVNPRRLELHSCLREKRYESRFFGAWVRWIASHRWVTIGVVMLLTGFAIFGQMNSPVVMTTARKPLSGKIPRRRALFVEFGHDSLFLVLAEGDVFSLDFLEKLKQLHRRLESLNVELRDPTFDADTQGRGGHGHRLRQFCRRRRGHRLG